MRREGETRKQSLARKFQDAEYRHGYVRAHTRRFLAQQVRELRRQYGLSQTAFGEKIGVKQTVISRLENPNYGQLTLETLFTLAAKLDIALFVRLVSFDDFVDLTEDFSDIAECPSSFKGSVLTSAEK